MIHINAPSQTTDRYVSISAVLCGPLFRVSDDDHSNDYRHPIDYLKESRGSYHENHCLNQQVNADLSYFGSFDSITFAPQSYYLTRVELSDGRSYRGLGCDGSVSVTHVSDYTYYAVVSGPSSITFFTLTTYGSGIIKSLGWQLFDQLTLQGTRVYGTRYVSNGRMYSPSTSPGHLPYPASHSAIVDMVMAEDPDLLNGTAWNAATISLSNGDGIGDAESAVNGALATIWTTPFGPKLDDYGDLAMEASQKFNATSVNMLAFIRDIENPVALVSKLSKLKGALLAASSYLTVHYGLLPTISDCQKLFDAATKARFNVDRNGFRTTSAGRIKYDQVDDVHQVLEQHIKIAVDNEDSGFNAVVNGAESIGVFPTLENLWDLIPFSFVVDWLTRAGDFLERVDSKARLLRFAIRYVVKSHKRTTTLFLKPTLANPFSGTVQLVSYWRRPSNQCPLPKLSLSPLQNPLSHWLEGTALIVQRRK